ncbi:hypothetical protein ACH4YO_42340 [Streptomyces noursei]|uniref:hypothetical protein n=1 Tax=Streptomyces noursei TaxID=1971 RepID=UPI0033E8C5E2
MPNVASAEQRAAQRRMVSRITCSGVLNRDGLALWRQEDCGEFYADAEEIAEDLAVLQVPCDIVTAYRFPLAEGHTQRPLKGYEVRITNTALPALEVWMPSLKQARAQLPMDAPGWGFPYFQPQPGKTLICVRSSLAASWPWWTEKQAERMGLLCAQCRYDLRRGDDESRMPYNIATKPGGWQLVCGVCCDDGIHVMGSLHATGNVAHIAAHATSGPAVPDSPPYPLKCGSVQSTALSHIRW